MPGGRPPKNAKTSAASAARWKKKELALAVNVDESPAEPPQVEIVYEPMMEAADTAASSSRVKPRFAGTSARCCSSLTIKKILPARLAVAHLSCA